MIAGIKGKVTYRDGKYAIIESGGIEYKVCVSQSTRANLSDDVHLWTHLHVKEDAMELYGFGNREELDFFELLIQISGIGPRSALGIISIAPLKALRSAILAGDSSYLIKVSGIGRKTAGKIILELKDKMRKEENGDGYSLGKDGDVVEALRSLGYQLNDAREALRNVSPETKGVEARIREALKILGGKR